MPIRTKTPTTAPPQLLSRIAPKNTVETVLLVVLGGCVALAVIGFVLFMWPVVVAAGAFSVAVLGFTLAVALFMAGIALWLAAPLFYLLAALAGVLGGLWRMARNT